MKKHTFSSWGEFSPAAYVSNGFIGFRFKKNPFHHVQGLLSGFYEIGGEGRGVQSMSFLPSPVVKFLFRDQEIEPVIIEQSYDFYTAEMETLFTLDCDGEIVTGTYTVFCSRTSPSLLLSEFSFISENPCDIGVNVHFEYDDPKTAKSICSMHSQGFKREDHDLKYYIWSVEKSNMAGVAFKFFGDSSTRIRKYDEVTAPITVTSEKKYLQTVTSFIPAMMHDEPNHQAHRMVKLASWTGFERLRELNRAAWAKLWESRIVVDGATEEWQNVIDASYFYVMCSASEFAPMSVGPFGLSINGFDCHCFWDTESFMFMPPLLCAPDIAESMLDYRYNRIDYATYNAKINGYKGIQFPWQSGVTGCEVTTATSNQAGGAGEQHVNLDIALAFDGYVRVSGDECFMREKAWPVIKGVAEWITSRVEKTPRGYEILHVTGIDEESDNVNNDTFTNLMSIKLLRTASEYSEIMGYGKNKKWLNIADKMFVPKRPDGVLPQYEGMQDDPKLASTTVMSHFPYGYTDTPENDVATFNYYMEHGMPRYLRYPMLSGFLGIFPAWAGDRKKSMEYYETSNLTFFCQPFYSATEWSIIDPADRITPSDDVPTNFITGRASLLSGLLMGLTKFCPWKGSVNSSINEWLGENIILPEGWNKITLNKVYIKGKAYRITAENGAKHALVEELPED